MVYEGINFGPPIGVVYPIEFPFDYQIEFYDTIVDTSASTFRDIYLLDGTPCKFKIYNKSTQQYIRFLWAPIIGDGNISVGDRLFLLEEDYNNVEQLSCQIYFSSPAPEPILPQAGDSLFITVIKPFSRFDRFIFTTGGQLVKLPDEEIIKPNQIQLYNNYPNPFNPETTIPFYLPASNQVKITIYDILGRKIKTLVNSKLSQGNYKINWNGKDNSNNNVASGIYILHFETNNFAKSRKMVLIR